jgi:signal transduction histidine kinase
VNAREVAARVAAVSLLVPGCAGLAYALAVPLFLGGDESARGAHLLVTAFTSAGLAAALAVHSLGYLPALFRAARALREDGPPLDEPSLVRLYAAPRRGAGLIGGLAVALAALAAALRRADPDLARAVAAVTGAAFAMTASLVYYPALRHALRPLFDALPPSDVPVTARGDRLAWRIALAVAAPSGGAALLAALLVSAHAAGTAHEEDELSARVFSVALGVRRLPGESPAGRAAAARALTAGGERVVAGVELPFVDAPPPVTPSPAGAVAVALALAGLAAVLAVRIGRQAAGELAQATRRVETVSLQQREAGGGGIEGAGLTFTFEVLSLPEVRAISRALDRVTERLASMARDQRRAVNARAEAARLRSFVLAGVSHDLRGPLNSVLGFAGLLASGVDGPVTDGQRESLEAIARSGTDLLRLVDDLLDAARLDAGRMTLNRARVLVGDLLEDARRVAIERCAGAVPAEVRLPVEGDLDVEAVVDRGRLAHHVGSLLAYALLRQGVAPAHGGLAPVTMHVRAIGESTWTLTVISHGSTPSRAALDQLFDPFELPPSGARAPAGLGMSLGVARRVIELHGGTAHAHVAPEGGLALHVTLTRARPRHSTPPPRPSRPPEEGRGSRPR